MREFKVVSFRHKGGEKRPANGDSTVKFPQIKEDFKQIQKLNDSILRLAAATARIDYAAVAKSAAEIKRRAARLKSNLFPDEPEARKEAKKKTPNAAPDLKTLATALGKALDSFVHSPLFQNINLVNPTDSIKTQKDLESVIELSGAIKSKAKN